MTSLYYLPRYLFPFVLLLAASSPVLSGSDSNRVEGAFTAFEVETAGEQVIAVHFNVGDRRAVADGETGIYFRAPDGIFLPTVLIPLGDFAELGRIHKLTLHEQETTCRQFVRHTLDATVLMIFSSKLKISVLTEGN